MYWLQECWSRWSALSGDLAAYVRMDFNNSGQNNRLNQLDHIK